MSQHEDFEPDTGASDGSPDEVDAERHEADDDSESDSIFFLDLFEAIALDVFVTSVLVSLGLGTGTGCC